MQQIEHEEGDGYIPIQQVIIGILFIATAVNGFIGVYTLMEIQGFYERDHAYAQHTKMRQEWEQLIREARNDQENWRKHSNARMNKHSWEIEQLQARGIIYEQWRDKTDAAGRFTPQRFRAFSPKIHKRDESEDQSPPWANPG